MTELREGRLLHITGHFDLAAGDGAIDYVTPVGRALVREETTARVIRLVGEASDGVDVKRAERARDRALERIKKLDAGAVDMPRAQIALERAEVRLRVAAHGR